LVAALTTNPFYLLMLGWAAFVVHSRHRVDGPHARSFRIFLIFGLVAIVTRSSLVFFGGFVTRESFAAAGLEGLRLAVLLVLFGTFNSVSDPFRVLKLAPRRFHEPALAAALALSIAPRTIDAVGRVREAQCLRGMNIARWRSWPALAVPVLETGMEEAVVLAESMDARGHGRGRRSSYRPSRWSTGALTISAAGAGSVIVYLWAAASGYGHLFVSTYPLEWPQASALLMGGTLAFALPALLDLEPDQEDLS
jgi:energy-coupling factor transport system permease protein